MIVLTYIYNKKSTIHVGKYTVRPMDPMDFAVQNDKLVHTNKHGTGKLN